MSLHRLDKTYNILWSFCVRTVIEVTGVRRGLRVKFQVMSSDLRFKVVKLNLSLKSLVLS